MSLIDEPRSTPVSRRRGQRVGADGWTDELAAARRDRALETFSSTVIPSDLDVPDPVTVVKRRGTGAAPKLSAEAFEMARQVYYLQLGTLQAAAEAIVAAGLSDTENVTRVRDRLTTWWKREGWPMRPHAQMLAIRDLSADGGLYRSERTCAGVATGQGVAPAGAPCNGSPLSDSEWCRQHDPRPEYVEARLREAAARSRSRQRNMVDIAPFQRWCTARAAELLAVKRAAGAAHPNSKTGMAELAAAMQVNHAHLARLLAGKHSDPARPPVTRIRASTVTRYVSRVGATFADVYGYEHTDAPRVDRRVCACGARKNSESETCRSCYEAKFAQCTNHFQSGRRCHENTGHASGICTKCRRQIARPRVANPRRGRVSALRGPVLAFALEAYLDQPRHAYVARRMWACNAGNVRELYANLKTFEAGLVKQFRRRELTGNRDAVSTLYEQLVAEHGQPQWPAETAPVEPANGLVDFAPFGRWLADARSQCRTYRELADRTGLDADRISAWLRRPGSKQTIRKSTVERALRTFDDGTCLTDLYPAMGETGGSHG